MKKMTLLWHLQHIYDGVSDDQSEDGQTQGNYASMKELTQSVN